ncbi:6-bladed beta-propeller [Fodinibius halophilus]|uniref:6-bladed beta-propeller n=1 Tax=Fodinibius halophilus TaxID=1736908 RepID=UPI00197A89F1|nr:6-bladed beta-propeller [Fodinibius halophilus]
MGLVSCQQKSAEQTPQQFVQSLPQEHPKEINRFQQAGDVYFSHLGYGSIPLDNGTALLALRKPSMLLVVDEKGAVIRQVARQGKGPGEVIDPLYIVRGNEGHTLVYDQIKQKILHFDKQLDFIEEITPQPKEQMSVSEVYPTTKEGKFIIRASSRRIWVDKEASPKLFLSSYTTEGRYGTTVTMKARPIARQIMHGKVVGGRYVPYAESQQIVVHPQTQQLYTYWTGSGKIAELSSDLDTLRTIPVSLPSQRLSDTTYDSLESEIRSKQWETLKEKLPEMKVPVEKMKIDHKGRFWLKLNYRGNTQMWAVMDEEGTFKKIVHLPWGSMLTHISKHHLGVRLDDITFALYEAVE